MSQVKLEMIWQHEFVLPYILNDLKQHIDLISPVHRIVLYGSRAKTDIENWENLQGKDWDIIVVTNIPIVNTQIWTQAKNYYIDLQVINEKQATAMLKHLKQTKELYPINQLELKSVTKETIVKPLKTKHYE